MAEYRLLEEPVLYHQWHQMIEANGKRMLGQEGVGLNNIHSVNIDKMDRSLDTHLLAKARWDFLLLM